MWRVMEVRLRHWWRERVRGGINQTYGGLAGRRDPPPTSTLHCSTSLTWWLGRWAMERGQRGVSVQRERSLMGSSKAQGVSTEHVRTSKSFTGWVKSCTDQKIISDISVTLMQTHPLALKRYHCQWVYATNTVILYHNDAKQWAVSS